MEQEAATTRRFLERVPEHELEWRPHPRSMTLGKLALHVATLPGAISRRATGDSVDVTAAEFEYPSASSRDQLLDALDESVSEARAVLIGLDEAKASGLWRLFAGERELSAMPRISMVRSLLLNHWYHHRGQLCVYLRLLDVPVPATYGPSADENPFAP